MFLMKGHWRIKLTKDTLNEMCKYWGPFIPKMLAVGSGLCGNSPPELTLFLHKIIHSGHDTTFQKTNCGAYYFVPARNACIDMPLVAFIP